MATAIKRIEKDFFLKVMYDEQASVIYLRNRKEYTLLLEKPVKEEMYLKADRPIPGLWPRRKLDLLFDFRGMMLMFSVEIVSVKDVHIVTRVPEFLYKDLERSYSRVPSPLDLQVRFCIQGDRYDLAYPKVSEYEEVSDIGEIMKRMDPKNLSGLIAQIAAWIKGFTDGYKIVFFKDVKPASTEERLLAETGKILFLPSTLGEFPSLDPFPKKRLIIKEMFLRYLESTGVEPDLLDSALSRFLREKAEEKIYAEVYIPILFQGYVIGYLYSWSNRLGKQPYNYETLETFHQFASVLAFSLKENGYFENGRLMNDPFEGKMIDISVSGLLFACPPGDLASSLLLPDKELLVHLITPQQPVNASAKIVRNYKDSAMFYFGCHFLDMRPEDLRFFFEFLYGKSFTGEDASFLSGQV